MNRSFVPRFGLLISLGVSLLLTSLAQAQPANWNSALWFEREAGAGATWRYYQFDSLFGAKQSVTYALIDLNNPAVDLKIPFRDSYVGPSPGLESPLYPREQTSVMASAIPNAKIAINGTFFNINSYDSNNPTVPWGGGTTFLRADGTTIHNFDGTDAQFSQALLFNSKADLNLMLKSGGWISRIGSWQNMMSCGPWLIANGTLTSDASTVRHPRTAVGKINATNQLVFLTVDGRTAESAGMSINELAQVMQAIGCDDAMNLDGGGSTTMWVAGEPFSGVVNYPSDNDAYDHLGQRRCANAIVVMTGAPTPKAWDGRVNSVSYNTLTRTGETLPVTVNCTNTGTEPWTAATVAVVPSRTLGRTSAFIPSGQQSTFFTMTPATVAPGQIATFNLTLTPPTVASNVFYEENFALSHTTNGYFGPADNAMRVRVTVRPPLGGAPPLLIVQGTPTGPNNPWLVEPAGQWANSAVSFTAAGVDNSGSQRYTGASTLGKYADFKPIFDVAGIYRVDAAYPASTNNLTSVQYKVNHLNGSNTVSLNQLTGANTWQTLGQYSFDIGSSGGVGVHSVRIINETTTGNRFYSGALRFDYISPLSTVTDWTLY